MLSHVITREPPDTALISYSVCSALGALQRFGCAFAALWALRSALQRFTALCGALQRFTALWALWQRFAQRFQQAKTVFGGSQGSVGVKLMAILQAVKAGPVAICTICMHMYVCIFKP